MNRVNKKSWQDIYSYLSDHNTPFVVFEEPVAQKTITGFNNVMRQLADNAQLWPLNEDDLLSDAIPLLYDSTYSSIRKKRLMVLFATSASVECYRALEIYISTNLPLKDFAIAAYQHARMVLEMDIMDKVSLYISSPLGGKNNAIRYAWTLEMNKKGAIPSFLKQLFKQECNFVLKKQNCIIERIAFSREKIGVLVLIPALTDPYPFLEEIMINFNSCGALLNEEYSVTNLEIPKILQKRKG